MKRTIQISKNSAFNSKKVNPNPNQAQNTSISWLWDAHDYQAESQKCNKSRLVQRITKNLKKQ